jgi:transcriptional regulator with XRE-family HTH domain
MEFGIYLRAEREMKRLSLRQLGRLVGVSKQFLFCIETGEVNPTPAICTQIALHLALDRDVVMLMAGHTPPDVLTLLQEHPAAGCAILRRELLKMM